MDGPGLTSLVPAQPACMKKLIRRPGALRVEEGSGLHFSGGSFGAEMWREPGAGNGIVRVLDRRAIIPVKTGKGSKAARQRHGRLAG